MSAMKRFAENVSVDMGFGGEITGAVMHEAQRRLHERLSHRIELDRTIRRLKRARANCDRDDNGNSIAGMMDRIGHCST